jgi:hypothetical protein
VPQPANVASANIIIVVLVAISLMNILRGSLGCVLGFAGPMSTKRANLSGADVHDERGLRPFGGVPRAAV